MNQALPSVSALAGTLRRRDGNREARLQAVIVGWLRRVLPGFLVCGLASRQGRSRKAPWMGVLPGVADVVVVAPDKILFLEIKAGSPVSAEPREFGMRVTELGFVWAVLRSLDDVGTAIAAVGIEVCNIEELSP